MVKKSFKIGDKVKVRDSSRLKKRIKNTIGVVKSIRGGSILIKWRTTGCVTCGIDNPCRYPTNKRWCNPCDIEPAIKVGEQLLFNFMLKGD